jgi:hypothetical protein
MSELRFSGASAARRAFIQQCQRLGRGTIERLEVRDCEPAFGPKTEVFRDLKLDGNDIARTERDLCDFALCKEILLLFSTLDSIRNGAIEHIEVRAGVPRRIIFKAADPALQEPK